MTELQWTLAVLGAGLGTYALRAGPFSHRLLRDFGRRHLRCLTYISFAVAAGIVSRAIFLSAGDLTFGLEAWIKALAVVVALAIYRFRRNVLLALFSAVGIAVLAYWLLAA